MMRPSFWGLSCSPPPGIAYRRSTARKALQRAVQLDNPRFSGTGRASAVDQYDGVRLGEDGDFAPRPAPNSCTAADSPL
jgi:hypothetical protein